MSVTWTASELKAARDSVKRESELRLAAAKYEVLQKKKSALDAKIANGTFRKPLDEIEYRRVTAEMKSVESFLNVKSALATAASTLAQTTATVKSLTADARELKRAANQLKRTAGQIEKEAPKIIGAMEQMAECEEMVSAVMEAMDTPTDLDYKMQLGQSAPSLPTPSFVLPAVPERS
jgi:methyl-accepting chemotaxis protein